MDTPLAQHMLDNLSTAVLWFDADLYLSAMNPAAENLLALSYHQLKGLHALRLFPERQCFKDLTHAPHSVIEYGLEFRLPNGRHLIVDCSVTPVRDPENLSDAEVYAFLVELVNADQHIRITREENLHLQRQSAHRILRGLAHEIKNPLGGIRGAAQLLARELSEEQQEFTEIIIGEADRLQNLLNRMLGSRTPPQPESVNIHKVLCQGRRLIQSEASAVRVRQDFDPSLPEVFVDPDQMHQVTLNIMRNAMQAMQAEGDLILRTRIDYRVVIGNHTHRLALRIDIQDNGPGIPNDMLEQIFYPMVSGRPEGTGLGLSIAQDLVTRNGGMILCESQPGKTVFKIWLPIEEQKR